MVLIYGINKLSSLARVPTHCTIGIFDGVHRGHAALLKKLIAGRKQKNERTCVLTFDPHPMEVLNPFNAPPLLTSLNHRVKLIQEAGIDMCIIVPFDTMFAMMNPEVFVRTVLVEGLHVVRLYVGPDFVFGRDRAGDHAMLKQSAKTYGFTLVSVEPFKIDDTIVSSTAIRALIEIGDLNGAAALLGRPVSILGTVIAGDRRGRLLGYPTANIDPHHEAVPSSGIYAVRIKYRNERLLGVVYIGSKPTFDPYSEPCIEVYIFNFNAMIYGEDLEIHFIAKIREDKHFDTDQALIKQIKKDIVKASSILKSAS